MRTRSRLLRTAAVATLAASAMAMFMPGIANASGIGPLNACTPGDGPYLKVLSNLGTVYHVVYGPIVDDNGTSTLASDEFTNTWSGTVSTTVAASLEVKVSDVISEAKASVTASAEASQTVTTGHTTKYNIDPHSALHVEYTVDQKELIMDRYHVNASCNPIDEVTGYAYVDYGVGWHTWETAY